MSQWTHVAAIVRIDGIGTRPTKRALEKIFGKELRYDDDGDLWDEADEHPERFLPFGSEGSLHMSVWRDADKHVVPGTTVSFFGDLRDYDNPAEIISWFQTALQEVWVRQATITANCGTNTVNWTYEG